MEKYTQHLKKYGMYGLLAVGVLAMLFGGAPRAPEAVTASVDEIRYTNDYADQMERRLEGILSQVQGVGTVSVMITLRSGEERILAEDARTSLSSGSNPQSQRDSKVTIANNAPLVLTELAPKVEGVIIIADGAGSADVQANLMTATAAALGVPSHKIAVLKKQGTSNK